MHTHAPPTPSYFTAWLGQRVGLWAWPPDVQGLRFGSIDRQNHSLISTEWRLSDHWNGRVYNQQEVRILLLPDGESIFAIFTSRFYGNPLPPFAQMCGVLRRNATTNEYIPGPPIWSAYTLITHAYTDTHTFIHT